MPEEATTQQDWQTWLLNVAERGLAAKWDAEYLTRYGVASQTPAVPQGQGGAGRIVPVQPAMFSPLVLIGGGLALVGAFYFLLRD